MYIYIYIYIYTSLYIYICTWTCCSSPRENITLPKELAALSTLPSIVVFDLDDTLWVHQIENMGLPSANQMFCLLRSKKSII